MAGEGASGSSSSDDSSVVAGRWIGEVRVLREANHVPQIAGEGELAELKTRATDSETEGEDDEARDDRKIPHRTKATERRRRGGGGGVEKEI